jgi:hypothetical protein
VFGETLAGIALSLALEGPAPWRAKGSGSIDLFLFSASFDFDESWGDPAPAQLATPDVPGILAGEFSKRESWVAQSPDLASSPVQLSAEARKALTDGTVVHPHGRITAHQKRLPLGITISRYERLAVAPQRWDVTAPILGAIPADGATETREEFAAAQYLEMTRDEELSRPSFEAYRAGMSFTSDRVGGADNRVTVLAWEEKTIDDDPPAPEGLFHEQLFAAMTVADLAQYDHPSWWQRRAETITIAAPEYVAANTLSLTAADDGMTTAVSTSAEVHELASALRAADRARQVNVVQAWELVH